MAGLTPWEPCVSGPWEPRVSGPWEPCVSGSPVSLDPGSPVSLDPGSPALCLWTLGLDLSVLLHSVCSKLCRYGCFRSDLI